MSTNSRLEERSFCLEARAGKEVLIKAVVQAIPIFAMGRFHITKEMCEQISRLTVSYCVREKKS